MLARGEIDFCISLRDVADPDLPSAVLYHDNYFCVARKKHPLKGPRTSLKRLCSFDHLLVDPTGRSSWGPVDNVLAVHGYRRRVAATVPSFHVMFELLLNDNFLAFVPVRLLSDRRSKLKVIETGLAIPPLEVMATWHPRATGDARHKWLREVLTAATGVQQASKLRST
jgi:DNA-binding transcriptional LysR family regulator